jgi:ABC-type nickel/cobalt efflux system permease component RcnA
MMSIKSWLQIASVVIVAVLGASVFMAWRGARKEQAKLQEKLNSAEQALRDADARLSTEKVEIAEQRT